MLFMFAAAAGGSPVDSGAAQEAVLRRLERDGRTDLSVAGVTPVMDGDGAVLLARAYELSPRGYVIVSADDLLPPVVAYSYENDLGGPEGTFGMTDLVRLDLSRRLAETTPGSPEALSNAARWASVTAPAVLEPLEQWPPAGTTPTGGWLEENWTQGAPYNALCPMDLIAGSRSVAGCPAVAMGMILDNLETTNSARFDDDDDYYHNYHEYYWIDDDHVAHGFPSWAELDLLLDVLDAHYLAGTPLTNQDKAALVVASGFACRQVFTASVSGTFGVGQAHDAYLRFGFPECELLVESSDSLFEKLSQNMMDALCAHLAIVDAGWQYGHNVVLDGYNTDEYYHINFGWGGSYNGWYQFPLTGMPYSMNVIEGIVLDIGAGLTGIEEGAQPDGLLGLAPLTNPSTGGVSVILELAAGCEAGVTVHDMSGRLVAVLSDGYLGAGTHQLRWCCDEVPAGVYLVLARGPASAASARVVLVR